MQNYKSILTNSFNLTITNKFLWLFGIFSGLFVSKNILRLLTEINDKISLLGANWIAYKEIFFSLDQISKSITDTIDNNIASLNQSFLSGAFIFMFFTIAAIIAIFSEIIIIDHISKSLNNQKNKLLSSFKIAWQKTIKVIAINIFFITIFWLLLKIIGLPIAIYTTSQNTGILLYTLSILATIFLFITFILFSITTLLATISLISENKTIKQAIKTSYFNIKTNWLTYLEFIILLLFIELVAAIILILIFLLFIQPAFVLIATLKALAYANIVINLIYVFLIICAISLTFLYGILFVYEYSLWISVYQATKEKKLQSLITRLYKQLSKQ